jgi:hypothetical protein
VELQVIEGAARPKIDAVLAGQRAGARYLRRAFCDAGQIEALPGGGRLPLLRQRVPAGYTASGLYGLRLLSGRRVQVEVRADPVRAHDPGAAGADATAVAGSVYAHPSREMHASFTVGKSWTFVRLGKRVSPASAASGSGGPVLDGDYGILYDIAVRLDNPTPAPHVVRLLLAPDAGGAQGVFLVNGKWIEAPHVSPPAEFELAQFLLGPQEHRVVNIRTLPVGGSAYPVTLVVR